MQADALHTCQDSRLPAAIQEDPLTNPIVYVPTPCNASESAQAQPAPDVSNSGAMKDMQEKLEALQKTLSRKDELLRVRNNQLVQAYDVLENRASLWNDSLTRVPPPHLPHLPKSLVHAESLGHLCLHVPSSGAASPVIPPPLRSPHPLLIPQNPEAESVSALPTLSSGIHCVPLSSV